MDSVTLDTNIYISAFEFGGIGLRFIALARAGQLRIDTSSRILEETIGVLRDKFSWSGYRLHFARIELEKLANVVEPRHALTVVTDSDDDKILECAVEAGSVCIITHDKHLLRLNEFRGIAIMTAQQYLARGLQR